jgi:hypothetical protein
MLNIVEGREPLENAEIEYFDSFLEKIRTNVSSVEDKTGACSIKV